MADDVKSKNEHQELGITQEYTGNRSLWDSAAAKKKYKEEAFGGKKTITDKDGTVLHISHNAAKKKYHHKNADGEIVSSSYAAHAAETDHIVPLENIHRFAKHNPLLSDDDLKRIANDYNNYQILSKSRNASKGADRSLNVKAHAHLQAEFTKTTLRNAKTEVVSSVSETGTKISDDLSVTVKKAADSVSKTGKKISAVTVKTGNNIGESVADAGKEVAASTVESVKTAAMNAIFDGVKRIVVDGESVDKTLVYEARAVAGSALAGKGEEFLIKATENIFANSGNEVLKCIAEQNAVGQILVLGASVGMSAMKYLEGEITAEELADEILLNGAVIGISTVITSFIPVPFIGPIITGIAVKAANIINQTRKHMNDYLIKETAIRRLSNEAIEEMTYQREKFNLLVKEDLEKWDKTVDLAFNMIMSGADYDNFNVDSIVEGLDTMLSLCGTSARFHSVEEWESQLDLPLELEF